MANALNRANAPASVPASADHHQRRAGPKHEARFGNLAEITHPTIDQNASFYRLLQTAIERSAALTRYEVQAEFAVGYEEIKF